MLGCWLTDPVSYETCIPQTYLSLSAQQDLWSQRHHLHHRYFLLPHLYMAGCHKLLGAPFCCPLRSWSGNWAQECYSSHVRCRSSASRYPRRLGNDVVRVISSYFLVVSDMCSGKYGLHLEYVRALQATWPSTKYLTSHISLDSTGDSC